MKEALTTSLRFLSKHINNSIIIIIILITGMIIVWIKTTVKIALESPDLNSILKLKKTTLQALQNHTAGGFIS